MLILDLATVATLRKDGDVIDVSTCEASIQTVDPVDADDLGGFVVRFVWDDGRELDAQLSAATADFAAAIRAAIGASAEVAA